MQLLNYLPVLSTLLLPAVADSQVNFYYDANCQDYAGSVEVALGQITGGPSGSQSMLWVNYNDHCYDTCGPNHLFCKNSECSAWDASTGLGQCKHFQNGVWATQLCGCLSCSNGCSGSPYGK